MSSPQPGILPDVPPMGRFLTFHPQPDGDPEELREQVSSLEISDQAVFGLGNSLLRLWRATVPGLRPSPHLVGPGVEIPATGGGIWCWLRGNDRGELVHATRELEQQLEPCAILEDVVDAFRFREGRDLSGYVDGTENPTGGDATKAAFTQGQGAGLDGSSFVAVQTWIHDLDQFQGLPQGERDQIIGRRLSDNEEMDDAPPSAHVKRTAQESFDPEAFVLRRSMPWADAQSHGLVFVAFGSSFDAFEALLRRMVGLEDEIVDGLFRFTRPVTGAYYWCPPIRDGHLDLRALSPS